MRPIRRLKQRRKSRAFKMLLAPILERFKTDNILESRGYRPLQMTFDDQLKALIFFHQEEFPSASAMLQAFEQNDFAKGCVAPAKEIQKSAFFEAINNRGLEQLGEVFTHLVKEAAPEAVGTTSSVLLRETNFQVSKDSSLKAACKVTRVPKVSCSAMNRSSPQSYWCFCTKKPPHIRKP